MARRRSKNLRYALLAIVISMILWGIAHGGSKTQKEYDLPIVFDGLPDTLVITDQSTSKINVRVQGSRAAFRNAKFGDMEYVENVSGGKPGRARYEVNDQRLDTPRGLQIVGLSPSEVSVRFERRGRKNVKIRAEVVGELPEGFTLGEVTLEPQRVWLTGARSKVMRITEVVTETIDVSSLRESEEREIGLALGTENVWIEEDVTVKMKIDVQPPEPAEGETEGDTTGEEATG
jgi:YbbR domain-containing protein